MELCPDTYFLDPRTVENYNYYMIRRLLRGSLVGAAPVWCVSVHASMDRATDISIRGPHLVARVVTRKFIDLFPFRWIQVCTSGWRLGKEKWLDLHK